MILEKYPNAVQFYISYICNALYRKIKVGIILSTEIK